MTKKVLQLLEEIGLQKEECIQEKYGPGDVIIRQGYPAEHIRFIIKGSVNVPVNASNGGIYLIRYSLAHSILGNVELLSGDDTYINGAIAVNTVETLAVPMTRARELMGVNVSFVRYMAKDLADKMKRTTQDILAAQTRTAEERLSFYLLETAEDGIYRTSLTVAANATGITYRHTWRLMQKLCGCGILSKEADGYHILQREELVKCAWKSG